MIKNKANIIAFFICMLLPITSYGMKARQVGKKLTSYPVSTGRQGQTGRTNNPSTSTGTYKPSDNSSTKTNSLNSPTNKMLRPRRPERTEQIQEEQEEHENLQQQIEHVEQMRKNAPYLNKEAADLWAQRIQDGLDGKISAEELQNIFTDMATIEVDLKAFFVDPSAKKCIEMIQKWKKLPWLSQIIIIYSYPDGSYMFFTKSDGKPYATVIHQLGLFTKYRNPTIVSLTSKIPGTENIYDDEGESLLASRLQDQANKAFKSNLDHYEQIIQQAESLNIPQEKIEKAEAVVALIKDGDTFSIENIEKYHDSFLKTEIGLKNKQLKLAEEAAEKEKIEQERIEQEKIAEKKQQQAAIEILEQEKIKAAEKEKIEIAAKEKKEEEATELTEITKTIEELHKEPLQEIVAAAQEKSENELIEKEAEEKKAAEIEAEKAAMIKTEKEKEEQEIIEAEVEQKQELAKAEKQSAPLGTPIIQPVVLTPIEPSEITLPESPEVQSSEISIPEQQKQELIKAEKQPAPLETPIIQPVVLTPIEPSEIMPPESPEVQSSEISIPEQQKQELIKAEKQPALIGTPIIQPVVLTPIEPSEIMPLESPEVKLSEIVIPEQKEENKEETKDKEEKKEKNKEEVKKKESKGDAPDTEIKEKEEEKETEDKKRKSELETVETGILTGPTLVKKEKEEQLKSVGKVTALEGKPIYQPFVPITSPWIPTETSSTPILQPQLQQRPTPQLWIQPQPEIEPQRSWIQPQPWPTWQQPQPWIQPQTPLQQTGPREFPVAEPVETPENIKPEKPKARLERIRQPKPYSKSGVYPEPVEGKGMQYQGVTTPVNNARSYNTGWPLEATTQNVPTRTYWHPTVYPASPQSYTPTSYAPSFYPSSSFEMAQAPQEEIISDQPVTKRITTFFSKIVNRLRKPATVLWERLELIPKWIVQHLGRQSFFGKQAISAPEQEKELKSAEKSDVIVETQKEEAKKEIANPILGAIKDFVSTTISYIRGLFGF